MTNIILKVFSDTFLCPMLLKILALAFMIGIVLVLIVRVACTCLAMIPVAWNSFDSVVLFQDVGMNVRLVLFNPMLMRTEKSDVLNCWYMISLFECPWKNVTSLLEVIHYVYRGLR